MGDEAPVGGLNRLIFTSTRFLRIVLVVLCALVIVAYGFIMDSACNSDDLTLVGKAFAVVSSMGYIFVMFILLMVQCEFEWFMKYFRFLDYWAVRSGVQMFMGVQILISKSSVDVHGLSFGNIVLTLVGWTLICIGLALTVLSILGARKYDHLGGGPKDVKAAPSVGKSTTPRPLKDPLMAGDTDGLGGGPQPRAAAAGSPHNADPFADNDEAYPYSRPPAAAAAPATPSVQYAPPPAPPPAAPAAPAVVDGDGFGADPFAARVQAARDDDISTRRQREDDELEKLYAQHTKGHFTAAD